MSLYTLKREYEERRQALVEQLQKNPDLDPATQHQIYGAIKEIENFLKTIELQIANDQEQNMNVALSNDRPMPIVEKTKGAIYHVANGTKRIFTHHIPNAAKKVTAVPKQYFDKRREEARLRAEIEAELRQRKTAQIAEQQPAAEHIVLEHPHQELVVQEQPASVPSSEPLPTWTEEQPAEPRTINDHVKRQHVIERPAKSKSHPSQNAPGKKGGQHKPHHKGRR
jgi:hypothetical protein